MTENPTTETAEYDELDEDAQFDEPFDEQFDEDIEPARDVLIDGPELFPGDTGTLPLKLRQALIRLLRGPYLDANSSDNVYNTVVDNQEQLRVRLSELFLELVVDEDHKVALLRPVEMAEPHTTALQRQREMTREETLLLLRMRLVLDRHSGTGNDATIARQDIIDVLEQYVDPQAHDAKGVEETADAAIRKLVTERRLLLPTELDDVWVISNALPLALPYEHIGDIITFMNALTEAPAEPALDSTENAADEPPAEEASADAVTETEHDGEEPA